MNKLTFVLVFSFSTLKTMAQTDPIWTMFQQNLIYYNPTLTENDSLYSHTAHLQNRDQWPEMSGGGYRTLQLLYHQKLGKSRSALGGYFLRDESGKILTRVRIGGIYSYDFRIQEKIALFPLI